MKYLPLIALVVLFSCQKADMSYTVKAGTNQFSPWHPTMPFKGKIFESTIMIGQEWFDGEMTDPVGFGTKLHGIGGRLLKPNYHSGGCNFALSYSQGKVFLTARYYSKISEGEQWDLHEGLSRTEVFPYIPISYSITWSDSTRFYVRGMKVAAVELLPNMWIEAPFCGRSGNDNNYPSEWGVIPPAYAARDLTLHIIR